MDFWAALSCLLNMAFLFACSGYTTILYALKVPNWICALPGVSALDLDHAFIGQPKRRLAGGIGKRVAIFESYFISRVPDSFSEGSGCLEQYGVPFLKGVEGAWDTPIKKLWCPTRHFSSFLDTKPDLAAVKAVWWEVVLWCHTGPESAQSLLHVGEFQLSCFPDNDHHES